MFHLQLHSHNIMIIFIHQNGREHIKKEKKNTVITTIALTILTDIKH